MSGPVAPMLALTITSYANNWYNTGDALDVKPLLYGGIATLLLEAFAAIPGMERVATGIGWLAFVGMLISPVQKPSPADNLVKITSLGNKKR